VALKVSGIKMPMSDLICWKGQ